ncbi:hypothetical protein PROFUN_07423 [Planoprotostelium fungivorum]|uniref:Uncharacterized protein n=1 Tax=Planoprotostelium fungivorum TaxID=1890364 RepID=A0A2P6NLF4_9EUKA|nr:hypothetical protein PROFUN_07423 [Planoprotostelium fungivorum]
MVACVIAHLVQMVNNPLVVRCVFDRVIARTNIVYRSMERFFVQTKDVPHVTEVISTGRSWLFVGCMALSSVTLGPCPKQSFETSLNSNPMSLSNDDSAVRVTTGSLSAVDNILNEIYEERNIHFIQLKKLTQTRETLGKELEHIDEELNILKKRREDIQSEHDRFKEKEDEMARLVEELNEKMNSINKESLRFESQIKSIKGILPQEMQRKREEKKAPKTMLGHTETIFCTDFTFLKTNLTDDNFDEESMCLLSASSDNSVVLWDHKRGAPRHRFIPQTGWVSCMQVERMSDDRFSLYTGSAAGHLELYHGSLSDDGADDIQGVQQNVAHTNMVSCLQADEDRLLSGSRDKKIKMWDLHESPMACVLNMEGHTGGVSCIQFYQYGLASGSSDTNIRLWDRLCHRTLAGHEKGITALQFDEMRVISGSTDKTIRLWDLRTGKSTESIHLDHPIVSLQFNSKWLSVSTQDKSVRHDLRKTPQVYDVNTMREELRLEGHTGGITCMKMMGDVLVTGSTDSTLRIWRICR